MIKKLVISVILIFLFPLISFANISDDTKPNINNEMAAFITENNISGATVQYYQAGKLQTFYAGQIKPSSSIEANAMEDILTGLILAQQYDSAKMQLTAQLKQFFPKASDYFEKVTVRSLATDTSGLPTNGTEDWLEKNQDISSDDVWQPSFFGHNLLRKIIEIKANKNLSELYQQQIFKVLGMKNSQLTATTLKTTAVDLQKFLAAAIGLTGTPKTILYPMRLTQTAFVELLDRKLGLGWYINFNEQSADHESDNSVKEVPEKPIFKPEYTYEKIANNMYMGVLPSKKSGIVIIVNKSVDEKLLMNLGRQLVGLS